MPAAARVTDAVGHSSALTGFLAGAAVGLAAATGIAIGAAVLAGSLAAEIASGGLATPLVAGALVTAGELAVNVVAGGYVMGKAEQLGESIGSSNTVPTGTIITGSPNVLINGKPAAFVTSKVVCTMAGHQAGDMVAAGASRVFINGHQAARVGDLIVCGGKILVGSPNLFIGSPMQPVLSVNPEIPSAVRTAVFIASLLPAGGGLLKAIKPALEAIAERGLTGSLKAGAQSLGRAMEQRTGIDPDIYNAAKRIGVKPKMLQVIRNTEKGMRPSPETYLPQSWIEHHASQFENGASRVMPRTTFERYGPQQRDGTTFIATTKDIDRLQEMSQTDPRKVEESLGLPEGQLGSSDILRLDFTKESMANLDYRIPSGNEAGANDAWIPGGTLPDGSLEAVVNGKNAEPGVDYHITPLIGK